MVYKYTVYQYTILNLYYVALKCRFNLLFRLFLILEDTLFIIIHAINTLPTEQFLCYSVGDYFLVSHTASTTLLSYGVKNPE